MENQHQVIAGLSAHASVVYWPGCVEHELAASPTVGTVACMKCRFTRPMTAAEIAYWRKPFGRAVPQPARLVDI
jgi:hypothetical protein